MFQDAVAVNKFQLAMFDRVWPDIAPEKYFTPGAGHGHTPAWIAGHLAIVGELGQMRLGGQVTHEHYRPHFAPGSPDNLTAQCGIDPAELPAVLHTAYDRLQEMVLSAPAAALERPHDSKFLGGTPIRTVGQLVLHMLTSHFGMHLAQLSACRRESGHVAIY